MKKLPSILHTPLGSASWNRREFCAAAAMTLTGVSSLHGEPMPLSTETASGTPSSFLNVIRPPDTITAFTEKGKTKLKPDSRGVWVGLSLEVQTTAKADQLQVSLRAPGHTVSRLMLRWHGDLSGCKLFLGDHWERSYADLAWQSENANRPFPWYLLTHDGARTNGYGVKTQPAAFCFWNADVKGLSLWIDVRSGGIGVELGERSLAVCDIVARPGLEGESPIAAATALCRMLCPAPLIPTGPVFGTNDWYYAYGNNDPEEILKVTEMVVGLCPGGSAKPFSVVDAGWSPGRIEAGPWDRANQKFGSMQTFADRVRKLGAEPGIWFRPLAAAPESPAAWRMKRDQKYLDPSIPEVQELVRADTRRMREWGFGMIKHDFTSFDIMGRWGFEMGVRLTNDGWSFADRSRTSAEIVLALYRTIREAAGKALVIGCNTFSHLSAGMFELNRIGDDTSGRSWDRTRRMGVNTLAFRSPQHNTFYACDPDCAPITTEVPWEQNRQWLKLVAMSGMPLIVSPQLAATGEAQKDALREAFRIAASSPSTIEPLDWMETTCPRRWKTGGQLVTFDWMTAEGSWPFSD